MCTYGKTIFSYRNSVIAGTTIRTMYGNIVIGGGNSINWEGDITMPVAASILTVARI